MKMGRTIKTIGICGLALTSVFAFTACSRGGAGSGQEEKDEYIASVMANVTVPDLMESNDNDYSHNYFGDSIESTPDDHEKYVKNVVIVYFESGTSEEEKQALVNEISGEIVGRFDTLDQLQIEVDNTGYDDLLSLCEKLSERPEVLKAKPDKVSKVVAEKVYTYPKDGYTDKWDEEKPGGDNWGLEAIKAPSAWTYTEKLSPVKVGVVDTGFDKDHADLYNVIKKADQPHVMITETQNHGTHVAGIIAAQSGNEKGVAGTSWNAELFCYGVGAESATDNELMERIISAVKDGCKVVNLSWGSSGSLSSSSKSKSSRTIQDEGEAASIFITKLLDAGYDFLIVQSAGNGAEDGYGVDAVNNGNFATITKENCYTGKYSYEEIMDHVIIVGSAGISDGRYMQSVFSNGGSNVNIVAPGEHILSTIPGGYAEMDGTSMATPFVTGAAASVWGADPSLSAGEVKKILCGSSSVNVAENPDSSYAHGTYPLLDLYSDLSIAMGISTEPTEAPKAVVKFDVAQYKSDSSGNMYYDYGDHILGLQVSLYKLDLDVYKNIISEASKAIGGNNIANVEADLIKEKGIKVDEWTFSDGQYESKLEPGHYVILDDTVIGAESQAAFTVTDNLSLVGTYYNYKKDANGAYTKDVVFERGDFERDIVRGDTVFISSQKRVVYEDANIVISNSYYDNLVNETQIELYRKDEGQLIPVNATVKEIQLYAAQPFNSFVGECYYPATYVIKCKKPPVGYDAFDDITFTISRDGYGCPEFKITDTGNSDAEITASDGKQPYYGVQDANPAVIRIRLGTDNSEQVAGNYYNGKYCSFYYPEAWVGNVEFVENNTNIGVHQKGHKEGWGWIYTLDFVQDSFYKDHGKQDEFYDKSGRLIWIVTPTDVQYEPDYADVYRMLRDQDLSVIKNSFELK